MYCWGRNEHSCVPSMLLGNHRNTSKDGICPILRVSKSSLSVSTPGLLVNVKPLRRRCQIFAMQLSTFAESGCKTSPTYASSSLFVFCSKDRTRLKILLWENCGFWLYYRRLEKGKFDWPQGNNQVTAITRRELRWLLDGLPIKQRHAHPEVTARLLL